MPDREKQLAEARIRLADLAEKMSIILPPDDVARSFLGCVIGVLANAYGLQVAKSFIAQFALEVAGKDVPPEWPPPGHA